MRLIHIPIIPESQQLKSDMSSFREWKIRMRAILAALKLYGHIDGTADAIDRDTYDDAHVAKAILISNMHTLDAFLTHGWDEAAMAKAAADLWAAVDVARPLRSS